MHPALEIPELLYLIFHNLGDWSQDDRRDLLSCCLTCKGFSEPALDLMWADLPSVTVMPFASPLEYNTDLNPDSCEYDETAYRSHLERLKFYGRRVRVLRVHSKLTPELLKCIMKLAACPSRAPSSPGSFMTTVFPILTSLNIVLSVNSLVENLSEPRIRTFFVPTVKDLALYSVAGARYDHLTDTLQSVKAVQPSLTSLTLGPEIVSDFSDPPPTSLDDALSSLINSLPQLEIVHLPPYLITHRVLIAISELPALEHLALIHPSYVLMKRSVPTANTLPVIQESPQKSSLSCLRSLTIKSTFGFIPQALYMHPSLTSHISHLSLSCLPPDPRITLKSLFSPTLSSESRALHFLTHLSLDFTVPISIPQRNGLGADFFAPLLAAPFVPRLASFHVRHRAPLDMTDRDFDDMARSMSKLESLRVIVMTPFDPPHGHPRQPPARILASLASLASFTMHCPSLREITLPVNAETLVIPGEEHFQTPVGVHPVAVDMSVSPVGDDILAVAKVLAKLFPNKRAQFTSQWADCAVHLDTKAGEIKSHDGVEGGEDYRVKYARRWKAIGQLVRQE